MATQTSIMATIANELVENFAWRRSNSFFDSFEDYKNTIVGEHGSLN